MKTKPSHLQQIAEPETESGGGVSLKHLVRRLRRGIVDVASLADGIGGVKIDHDLKATEALMVEAADEIERMAHRQTLSVSLDANPAQTKA